MRETNYGERWRLTVELKEPPELEPPMELLEEEAVPRELFEFVAAIGAETLLGWGPVGRVAGGLSEDGWPTSVDGGGLNFAVAGEMRTGRIN
jgi:hypothetical protein